MKKILITLILLGIFIPVVFSDFGPLGTITQTTESLNFGNASKNLTVDVFYNCTGIRQFNVTFPSGLNLYATGAPCGLINSSLASCNFNDFSPFYQGSYSFTGSTSLPDNSIYELQTTLSNETNCSVLNNISVIKVPDENIFHTLVEYGRGRGNYFFDSGYSSKAGSGHTGVGCPYVPNGTLFELNFLHKVFSVAQFYGDFVTAKDVSFTCSYPNRTIVRTHLGTNIVLSNGTTIDYAVSEIGESWERMGYLGMDFDTSEQAVGENLTISCSNITYTLEGANGNISVFTSGDTFNLQVRNPNPFVASAAAASTIGNGTQEVAITYNITHTELYPIKSIILEISAPPFASFIGTRGELWGTARDEYRIERIDFAPGESEIITLIARFDTSTANNMTSTPLSAGIRAKYVACWDENAYNPAESVQDISFIGTASVNMGISSEIVSLTDQITQITNIMSIINTTTIQINTTVNNLETVIQVINTTTTETNFIVKQINTTVNNILNKTTIIANNTNSIINNTNTIQELLDCDGINDTSLCSDLDSINNTATNIQDILISINNTLNNITINVTVDLSGENLTFNITANLTNITLIVDDIFAELNCTNVSAEPEGAVCNRLIRIENNTFEINDTVNEINQILSSFNLTFGNLTIKNIIDNITNITVDTSSLLEEIQKIKEFDEELVFLITDSFGLQQEARKELNRGNLDEAAAKLREANERLSQAAVRLRELQGTQTEAVDQQLEGGGFGWVIASLFILLTIAVGFYLFSRPSK